MSRMSRENGLIHSKRSNSPIKGVTVHRMYVHYGDTLQRPGIITVQMCREGGK